MRINGVKKLIVNIMKYALLSVFNKIGIVKLAESLIKKNYKIISTGGTYNLLKTHIESNNIISLSNFTQFPEIMGGRVKSLHPKIYGGILAQRNNENHMADLNNYQGKLIDIVAVNLYPFKDVIDGNHTLDDAIENIDIGGVSLVRAAGKNYYHTMVLTNPEDYHLIDQNTINIRKMLAVKGFQYITNYDSHITSYLSNNNIVYREYQLQNILKYGCNPGQEGHIYTLGNSFDIINGHPGYINYLDAIFSWGLVNEAKNLINLPIVASFKHNAPTGVSTSHPLSEHQKILYNVGDIGTIATAFIRARNADPMSSFGDFIACSHTIDVETALLIKKEVSDGIIAPDYHPEALSILKQKKGGKYIIFKGNNIQNNKEYRELQGIVLSQTPQKLDTLPEKLKHFPLLIKNNLLLANATLKYTPSNSIAFSYDGQIIGVAAGQQNRVDCVRLAGNKAKLWGLRHHQDILTLKWEGKKQEKINQLMDYLRNCDLENPLNDYCMASDGFFPFPDNIEEAKKYHVKYITNPGGGKSDNIIQESCQKNNIINIQTNLRLFHH